MDATKKSASQIKREAIQAKKESGKRKAGREAGGAGGSKRHKHAAFSGDRRDKSASTGFHGFRSAGPEQGPGSVADLPPRQKKKIDKPKHLKRKLMAAQELVEARAEGAESIAAALADEQKKLEEKKKEAKDKFYELCKTLVGLDKWDDEKQSIYDKLVNEKGCEKKKFLAALGVEEAQNKVKHRPARDAPGKRKQISRAKKSALQQKKQAHDKNKIGVVISHKHTSSTDGQKAAGTKAESGK